MPLELKRLGLKHIATFDELSNNLTMRDMLIAGRVSDARVSLTIILVVSIFLTRNDKVVYVGQVWEMCMGV